MSLPQTDPAGRIYAAALGTPSQWNAGVGYTALGQMCTTIVGSATDAFLNGWRLTSNGLVVVADQAGLLVFNGGLPFKQSAVQGAMARQVDVTPGADDPYVGGIRVGPLGGVYFTSATPPSVPSGFSAGFSTGFF